jgi:V/A-type H+-transporting ATPase subunit A
MAMTTVTKTTEPVVTRISGPIVTAVGMYAAQMYEVVAVGSLGLAGEVVRLVGDHATIQVYEDTTMLKPGAPVKCSGAPLYVLLGPGLIGSIYDGIQRPLPGIEARSGAWIRRGEKVDPLDRQKSWAFEPQVKPGEIVAAGQAIGWVAETPLVNHRIMTPPDLSGTVLSVVDKGEYRLLDPLAVIETATGPREVTMVQRWPVRVPRPIRERLRITEPLITGQLSMIPSSPSAKAARRPFRAGSARERQSPSTNLQNGQMQKSLSSSVAGSGAMK